MDAFDTAKPDRFQQPLSSAWASFLNAQHCNHEINALRRTLDEHIRQSNSSISSLQRDTFHRHDLFSAELKSKLEQCATENEGLRNRLSTLQQDINQDKGHTSRELAELSGRLSALQESLDGARSNESQNLKSVQEHYRLALEKVESLQAELRELKAEKMASERRMAALEHQIATITEPRQEFTEETIMFLSRILPRQNELMRVLDRQDWETSHQRLAQFVPNSSIPEPYPPAHVKLGSHRGDDPRPNKPTGRQTNLSLQPNTQPVPPPPASPGQDIRTLYLVFRDRYKSNPPRSDVDFIWEFISRIESPALSVHVQESLATLLPEYVTRSRDTRRKNPQRHITISRGLTWRKFREALVKIPTAE